jgi:hypothetical protein
MRVHINWIKVEELKVPCNHGIEIYYGCNAMENRDERHLVAFVVDFAWWHNESDIAEVQILKSDSPKYAYLGVDGNKVINEVKRVVRKYIPERKPFPHMHMSQENKPISKNLTVWVNG